MPNVTSHFTDKATSPEYVCTLFCIVVCDERKEKERMRINKVRDKQENTKQEREKERKSSLPCVVGLVGFVLFSVFVTSLLTLLFMRL